MTQLSYERRVNSVLNINEHRREVSRVDQVHFRKPPDAAEVGELDAHDASGLGQQPVEALHQDGLVDVDVGTDVVAACVVGVVDNAILFQLH